MKRFEKLYELGLKEEFEREYDQKYSQYFLGRVAVEHKNAYRVITERGEGMARISGKLGHSVADKSDYPAVGDWVVLDREDDSSGDMIIHGILKRKSEFSRKVAGKRSDKQVVSANVDTLFLCMALNNDFNIRRLERYISLAWESGARPVIVLTKTDLCEDIKSRMLEVEQVAFGIEILTVSALTMEGVDNVRSNIGNAETVAFIGSSGTGKSTLINALFGGEIQRVSGLRNDDRGRHTTTYRELIKLPGGGIVIDTPGMRELQMYDADMDSSFSDIEELAAKCRYSDCAHESEPGCAVKKAIEEGRLSQERLKHYKKLKKELEYMEDRKSMTSKQMEKKKIIGMMGSLDATKKIKKR